MILYYFYNIFQLLVFHKKIDTGGEDAFFVSKRKGGVIAVADGVSGYGLTFWLYV